MIKVVKMIVMDKFKVIKVKVEVVKVINVKVKVIILILPYLNIGKEF
jgi:hypothetical protein